MTKRISLVALLVTAMSSAALAAGPGCGKHKAAKKSGCSKSQATAQAGGANTQATAEAVLAALPSMSYVGGKTTTKCFDTAAASAGCASKVKYMVSDSMYDTKGEATEALVTLLEREADTMMTVRYVVGGECVGCPTAAKTLAASNGGKMQYRLAGFDFDTQEQADVVSDAVRKALAATAGCSQTCSKTAAGKSGCCATGSAATASGKSGCGSKGNAATASGKSGCGSKSAATASGKSGCGSKSAATAAGKSGCCSKSAATASGKSGCGSKSAATASGKSGCGSKSKAATASGKSSGCSKSCGQAKGVATTAAKDENHPSVRLTAVQERLRLIVETAEKASTS